MELKLTAIDIQALVAEGLCRRGMQCTADDVSILMNPGVGYSGSVKLGDAIKVQHADMSFAFRKPKLGPELAEPIGGWACERDRREYYARLNAEKKPHDGRGPG